MSDERAVATPSPCPKHAGLVFGVYPFALALTSHGLVREISEEVPEPSLHCALVRRIEAYPRCDQKILNQILEMYHRDH